MQNRHISLYKEALEKFKLKKFDEAYELCKNAVELQPSFAEAYHLSAVMLMQSGKYSEAVPFYKKALSLNPLNSKFLNNSVKNYLYLMNLEDAEKQIDSAIQLFPNDAETWFNRAKFFTLKNETKKAIENYRKSIKLNPLHLAALNNLSNLCFKEGEIDEAEELNAKVLHINPVQQEALLNSANILKHHHQFEDALKLYKSTYEINKLFIKSAFAYAELLLYLNMSVKSQNFLRSEIKYLGNEAKTFLLLGKTCFHQKDYLKAIEYLQKALKLKPENIDAIFHLGLCAHSVSDIKTAIRLYKKAVETEPENAEFHLALARAFFESKDYDASKMHYLKSLEINPRNKLTVLNYIKLKAAICDWTTRDEDRAFYISLIDNATDLNDSTYIPILDINYFNIHPEYHLKAAKVNSSQYLKRITAYSGKYQFEFDKKKSGKIKIGYLSPDFRNHPVGKLIHNLFQYHNREQYEIYAYSLVTAKNDDFYRSKIAAQVDYFKDISKMPYFEAAQLIYNDKIDILIDLAGYTTHSVAEIVAMKPAPIQIQFLGFPDTMGLEQVDYIMVDQYLFKNEDNKYYTEQALFIPHAFIGSPLHVSERIFTKSEFGIPENSFVFCSFCSTYKFEPEIFTLWMKILEQVPDSVLWLSGNSSSEYQTNILRFVKNYGIDEKRIFFANQIPDDEYLARYALCDLFLDTLYYSAGSTAIASIYMNVPVLTICGETNASRMGASICYAAGLDEFVTTGYEEYISKALYFSNNKNGLAQIKRHLMSNKHNLPLFNTERFVFEIENIFETLTKKI